MIKLHILILLVTTSTCVWSRDVLETECYVVFWDPTITAEEIKVDISL